MISPLWCITRVYAHSLDRHKNIKTGMHDLAEYIEHFLALTCGGKQNWPIYYTYVSSQFGYPALSFVSFKDKFTRLATISFSKDSTVTVWWSGSPNGGKCCGSSKKSWRLVKTRSKIASFLVGFFTICLLRFHVKMVKISCQNQGAIWVTRLSE